MSLLVLSARTRAAQLQRETHARERELLLRQALEASDAERRRIARNLHDGVVQDLAAIALGLRRRADQGSGSALMTMQRAADATGDAIEELRTLLQEIAPPDLQEIGLTAALSELADPLRAAGIEVSIRVAREAEAVRGTALTAAYRIAQEALRNVNQHARAHHVRRPSAAATAVSTCKIADDGIGFSAETRDRQVQAGHLGLTLIQDLARESGGDLESNHSPARAPPSTPISPSEATARRRPPRRGGPDA